MAGHGLLVYNSENHFVGSLCHKTCCCKRAEVLENSNPSWDTLMLIVQCLLPKRGCISSSVRLCVSQSDTDWVHYVKPCPACQRYSNAIGDQVTCHQCASVWRPNQWLVIITWCCMRAWHGIKKILHWNMITCNPKVEQGSHDICQNFYPKGVFGAFYTKTRKSEKWKIREKTGWIYTVCVQMYTVCVQIYTVCVTPPRVTLWSFHRTQVSLGSDLWVLMSLTQSKR